MKIYLQYVKQIIIKNIPKYIYIYLVDIIQLKFKSCNIPLLQNFCLVLHLWLMSHIRSEVADIIWIIRVVKYDLCAFFYMSALLTSKFVTEACAAHVKPLSNDTLHIIRSNMFRNKCSIFSFDWYIYKRKGYIKDKFIVQIHFGYFLF